MSREEEKELVSKLELSTLKMMSERLDRLDSDRKHISLALKQLSDSIRLITVAVAEMNEERNIIHKRLAGLEESNSSGKG